MATVGSVRHFATRLHTCGLQGVARNGIDVPLAGSKETRIPIAYQQIPPGDRIPNVQSAIPPKKSPSNVGNWRWVVTALILFFSAPVTARRVPSPEEQLGACEPGQAEKPFESRGLKVLITRLVGMDDPSRSFGANVSHGIKVTLPEFLRREIDARMLAAGLNPNEVQTEYVPCIVDNHRAARAIGEAWGADLVVWGTAIYTPLAASDLAVLNRKMGKGATIASHNQVNAASGAVVQIVGVLIKLGPGASYRTNVTLVKWEALDGGALRENMLGTPPMLQDLSLPKLVGIETESLFHLLLGLYAFKRARFSLAANQFERAGVTVPAQAERTAQIYLFSGISYLVAGELERGTAALRTATRRCEAGDALCSIGARQFLALAIDRRGQHQEALREYDAVLASWHAAGNVWGQATAQLLIGGVWDALGNKDKALERYNLALPLWRQIEHQVGIAATHNNLGKLYTEQGRPDLARQELEKALQIYEKLGYVVGQAIVLANLGVLASETGDATGGLAYLERALPLVRQSGHASGEARVLNALGKVRHDLGEEQRALEILRLAYERAIAAPDYTLAAAALINQAVAQAYLGQPSEADRAYEQALRLSQQYHDARLEVFIRNNQGQALDMRGAHRQALVRYTQAAELARKQNIPSLLGRILLNQGVALSLVGERVQAEPLITEAVKLLEEVKDGVGRGLALVALSDLRCSRGEYAGCLADAQQGLALLRAGSNVDGEVRALANIAQAHAGREDPTHAFEALEQAMGRARHLRHPLLEAELYMRFASLYDSLGKLQAAAAAYEQARQRCVKTQNLGCVLTAENNLGYVLVRQREYAKADALLLQTEERCKKNGERSTEASVQINLGVAASAQGHHRQAVTRYERALAIAEGLKAAATKTRALSNLCDVEYKRDDIEMSTSMAERRCREAYKSAEETGNLETQQLASQRLGSIVLKAGDSQQAVRHYEQALALAQRTKDRAGEAQVHADLGAALTLQREIPLALRHHQEALTLYRQLANRGMESLMLGAIGDDYQGIGADGRAEEMYLQGLEIARQVPDPEYDLLLTQKLARIKKRDGRTGAAIALLQGVLARLPRDHLSSSQAITTEQLSNILHQDGQLQTALSIGLQAVERRHRLHDIGGEASALASLASIYDDLNQPERARDALDRAMERASLSKDASVEAIVLKHRGDRLSRLRDRSGALAAYQAALAIHQRLKQLLFVGQTEISIANIHESNGSFDQALEAYQRAIAVLEKVGSPTDLLNALHGLALVQLKEGHPEHSLQTARRALTVAQDAKLAIKEGVARLSLARAYDRMRKIEDAIGQAEAGRTLLKAEGGLAQYNSMFLLGVLYRKHNEPERSIQVLSELVTLRVTLDHPSYHASVRHALARAHRQAGDLSRAQQNVDLSIALYEQLPKEKEELAEGLALRAAIERDQGQADPALRDYRQAAVIFGQLEKVDDAATILLKAGELLFARRRLPEMAEIEAMLSGMGKKVHALQLAARRASLEAVPEVATAAYGRWQDAVKEAPTEVQEEVRRMAQAGLVRAAHRQSWHACGGIVVLHVVPGSVGAEQGIQAGDVLLRYQGACLELPEDLISRVVRTAEKKGALPIPLVVWHGGKLMTLSVPGGRLGLEISTF